MNMGMTTRLWFGLAVLACGCGGSGNKPPPITNDLSAGAGGTSVSTGGSPGSGGTTSTGGQSADSGTGTEPTNPLAPVVTITSPLKASDANAATVLVEDGKTVVNGLVVVTCTAIQGHAANATIDPATVQLEMFDGKGASQKQTPGVTTGTPGEYSATFNLTGIANGPMSFTCTASDKSTTPLTTKTTLATFVDHGPSIQVGSPTAGSPHPLKGPIEFNFSALGAPLTTTGDNGAAVAGVTLSVNGQMIDLSTAAVANSPGEYDLSIDFSTNPLFTKTPVGSVPVVITATDSRTPTPAKRTTTYTFVMDSTGPAITAISPPDKTIIGGQVHLQFTVTDDLSGVDPKTVEVDLGSTKHFYTPGDSWSENNGTYTFSFDSSTFDATQVQVTVNIRASDLATNAGLGASVTYYIDNQPPIVDLDPPKVREAKQEGAGYVCSDPFDPLGSAISDTATGESFELFRALVWEQTNEASGQTILYPAGTNQSSVQLYLQPDPTQPLLISKNGTGGVCNEIANLGTLNFLALNPVPPAGSATYSTNFPAIDGMCTVDSESPPLALCLDNASDLTRVLAQPFGTPEPAIYASGDLSGLTCTGAQWQLSSPSLVTQNGWVCLAGRATDNVGNVGVSAPLRICVNDPANGAAPDCATMSTTPPTCVTNCTAPAHFNPPLPIVVH
jgi:hypothetical protein